MLRKKRGSLGIFAQSNPLILSKELYIIKRLGKKTKIIISSIYPLTPKVMVQIPIRITSKIIWQ